MLPKPKQIFLFLSKKVRSLTGLVEKAILITVSIALSLLFLIHGGADPGKHALIVPIFGFLILLHGFYVYLRDISKRREGDYELCASPFKFVPFLIWAIVSVNLISPVPWIGQIYLIYFFEAFIIFWMLANHVKKLKQLGIIFVGLSIPFLMHLYLGFDQFFHGNSLSELGVAKIVSGIFFESNSYVFLSSILIAGLVPAFCFRYWKKVKRFLLLSLFLLLALGLIMANNFQGFLMLLFACLCCSYFVFYKNSTRIKVLLTALVVTCAVYVAFNFSFTAFGDYFHSAFSLGENSYFFTAWIASLFLFFKNCLIGVGLGGFEAKLYSVQSFNFPLIISNPSSFYLLLLSEFGILGAFLLAKPLILLLREKYQYLKSIPKWKIEDRRRRVPIERLLFSILISTVITFLLISLFHSVIIIPLFVCLFAVLIAVLNFNISPNSSKIIKEGHSLFKKFVVRKNTKDARYYFGFACLLAALFAFDGYKVLKSQDAYERAVFDFQTILQTPENFQDEDLWDALDQAEDSIGKNRYNLDAWLLKNEILHALYNKNPIRFNDHLGLMLETSQFVLEHKKNYWYAWMRHGISLTLNGDLIEAENAFNRAIQLAPNNFETNFYMGSYLMNFKDRLPEADEYIEKALVIAPTNEKALALRQKLKL
jgi:tetratricopeptide (TPR) repeat protein